MVFAQEAKAHAKTTQHHNHNKRTLLKHKENIYTKTCY